MPVPEFDEHAADFHALAELAEAFTYLVDALVRGGPRGLTPPGIVDLAQRCMPRGQHVGIAAYVDGRMNTVAASSDLPSRLDRISDQTGEGPALDVIETNDFILSGDLTGDMRWPAFGTRTVDETGILSMLTYRLYLSARHRAALSFYSDWPHAFDQIAISTGAIFAAYASLTSWHRMVLDEPVGQRRSKEVHREIGVAIGILMSVSDMTTEAAYQRLHAASRRLRRSLPETARHVVEHRRLPDESSRRQ
jgi:hypothetical protein